MDSATVGRRKENWLRRFPARLAGRRGESVRIAGKTVLAYVVVSALWILLSDHLVYTLASTPEQAQLFETYKGWLFITVTAVLLFWRLEEKFEQHRTRDEKLQLFLDHAPSALAMLNRELRYMQVSRRWNADYGLGEKDLRGLSHYEVFPETPEKWRDANRRALHGETVQVEAECVPRKDGSLQWLRWQVRPWRDAEGLIGGIVLCTEDITARKVVEEELKSSQARLALALECGKVGTWSWNLDTGTLECDEVVARFLGRTREELAEGGLEHFWSRLHPDDLKATRAKVQAVLASGNEYTAEYRVIRPDDEVAWIVVRAWVERDSGGRPKRMIGAGVDVTPMKRVMQALQESQNRLQEVVDCIRAVFWTLDVARNVLIYVSPAFEEIWGRSCAELYKSTRVWTESIHLDDRERVLAAVRAHQISGTYDETYRVVRPDGGIRWVRDHAYVVRDERGTALRIVGTAEDVTERKKLEEQFLHAQRLEAVGTLASGVAHDLNNILAPMFMIGPLLKPKLSDPADEEMLMMIEQSARRGADVVRQLLAFTRGIGSERGPIQLRHLFKEMISIMAETFPREIGITQQIAVDLWPVVGDATQLHQVLMNLCVNARDAMPDGGKLSIHAGNLVLTEQSVGSHPDRKPGRYVVITVTDTGEGIPPEIQSKIFEPFFTTKEVGKGTGLGLSTVLGIVTSHGGFVMLDSEPGRGSSFRVHLPSDDAAGAAHGPTLRSELREGNGEVVLVVDDEPAVRLAMQQVLERQGYRVLLAADGREGLGIYLRQRQLVRAVITDLMMPEMGGVALVRAIRDLSPSLAILASTGQQTADKEEALATYGVTEVLPKPYAPFELLEALDRELRKSRLDS